MSEKFTHDPNDTNTGITVIEQPGEMYRLLQHKHAIKLELLGMRHSSGRSASKHACAEFNIPYTRNKQAVLDAVQARIDALYIARLAANEQKQ